MREILFKAKKLNGSEWVIGSYVHTFNEDKKCPVVGVMTENHWIVEISGNMILIDKDTICQYTGLTDKNGNKIWENDVVEIPGEDDCFKVMWSDTEARYEMQSDSLVVDFDNYWSYEVEVIGNTFDNACIDELLKGEEG